MRKHTIPSLNNKHMETLNYNKDGHTFYLPNPGVVSTLSIYCYDDNSNEYHVTDVTLDGTDNVIFYLDPDKYPHTDRISWVLSNASNANLPYNFFSIHHGKPDEQ